MEVVINIVFVGVFATVAIDVWATFSNRLIGFPRTNWAMVGRWLGHIPRGKLVHNHIQESPAIRYENILGWMFHYLIGIAYSTIFVGLCTLVPGRHPTLLVAWAFGLATILSPWLIMHPGLGLGVCASKAPKPNMVRLQNLFIHSIFGIALFYGWQACQCIRKVST